MVPTNWEVIGMIINVFAFMGSHLAGTFICFGIICALAVRGR